MNRRSRWMGLALIAALAPILPLGCGDDTIDLEDAGSSPDGSVVPRDGSVEPGPRDGSLGDASKPDDASTPDDASERDAAADAAVCVASACPGEDNACQTRTCTDGACGFQYVAQDTEVAVQVVGDCKSDRCDGAGHVVSANDDADLPNDLNPCTDDVCVAGVASNPTRGVGAACGQAGAPLVCTADDVCVGCNTASDCAGNDGECAVRTCTQGICGFSFTQDGTAVATQTSHDCLKTVCDGAGLTRVALDDLDVPLDDGNECTEPKCTAGIPSQPSKADGSACSDDTACTQTDTCQAGVCSGGNPVVCGANATCAPAAGTCSCTNGKTFATPIPYTTGAAPTSVAVGDFNEDGKPDLVLANHNASTVSVLLHTGATFGAQTEYSVGGGPIVAVAADLDGDGHLDLAVANQNVNTVSILRGAGDGTFGAKTDYSTGSSPTAVVAADLNGDGKPDLVVPSYGGALVGLLFNHGDGTFAPPISYFSGSAALGAAVADLNGDGRLDVVVTTQANRAQVLLNNGDGTFAAPVTYLTGSAPAGVTAADLNGDGHVDLAVPNAGNNTVSVLFNRGDGTFTSQVQYFTGAVPNSLVATDLNGDGKTDLAVANSGSNTVSVLLNGGNGTFEPKTDFLAGAGAYSVAAADLNGDGDPDLAVADAAVSQVSVLLRICAAP